MLSDLRKPEHSAGTHIQEALVQENSVYVTAIGPQIGQRLQQNPKSWSKNAILLAAKTKSITLQPMLALMVQVNSILMF